MVPQNPMPSLAYSFLMPPTIFIAISLAAAIFALRCRRLGILLMLGSSLALYLSALPVVTTVMLLPLTVPKADPAMLRRAQAIVVLGAGLLLGNGTDTPDAPDSLTLERLAWAVRLYRLTNLPIAVTGGHLMGSKTALGILMARELDQDFQVPVRWIDAAARTTFENAEFTAALLKASGCDTAVIVTNGWHLRRAIWSFERVGINAVPYPAGPISTRAVTWADFLPSVSALHDNFYYAHELLGLAYYRLRY
jgi:uncharacterized SAM-binding protein YcdF (DUF218 family)